VLFANLQHRDSADVVEKLKATGVPYKLADGGATILIPERHVAETRLALAQDGLPRGGGVGYEIFDRTRLGITSFEQKINFKRAIEGELARTINQLNEVQWSRVQIAMPEERLFLEEQEEPTAAVFLNLLPGRSLDRNQIRAIQHLIANSVKAMKPSNITILDQHANPLAMPSSISLASSELSSSQFELRSRVERHFQRKIQSMFDRIVGPGKSAVSVSVDLDFDRIERTEEIFDPDGAVVRSEERQKESTTAPSQPGGIAGISANLPTVAPPAGASMSGPRKETAMSVTNYEISKTIAHIIKSPSSIKGISASVVVDGVYKLGADSDGKTTREYSPRSDDEIEKYKRMVLAAIGNTASRSVEVINVPLEATATEWELRKEARALERRDLYFSIGKGAITIITLGFIFLLVRQIIRRALPEMLARLPGEVGARVDLVAEEGKDIVTEVQDIAEKRPSELADLVKVWVKEQE
jgi:flagellar M-ring protein FliF